MNTENNQRKALIIPDLHLRWFQAQKILDNVPHDEVIFLGDFFDDFNDDPQSIGEMADWLQAAVRHKNFHFIYGNHDVHYANAARHLQCSGYADWKYFIIRDRYEKTDVWDHFKWFHILDGKWLLSHGGLHKFNLPEKVAKLHEDRPKFMRELEAYLNEQCRYAWRESSWVNGIGHSRGGCNRVGGLTWCDFEREFYPVKGLNQIVGHTPQGQGTAKWCFMKGKSNPSMAPIDMFKPLPEAFDDVNASYNVDLDVWKNTHWALWDGKDITFGNYNRLMHELASS